MDAHNHQSAPPLHIASSHTHTECANELLTVKNIPVNKQDKNSATPQHSAVQRGAVECAKALLAQPAVDANIKDAAEITLLLITAVPWALNREVIPSVLLQHGTT